MSYEVLDFNTGLPVLLKQPGETRKLRMDFASLLIGASIVSVDSVAQESQGQVPASDDVTLGTATFDGSYVLVPVSGGTDGERYKITVIVTDSDGNVLEGDGMLYVRDL